MPSTHAPRPHSSAAPFSLLGSDPTRQPRHVYVSTTDTGIVGVDFMAVERVVNGGLPTPELNEAEQELAARIMTRAGRPARDIAERVGVETRTVTRWRAAWRKEEA
ncbi:helix-turn-helix domain containing protein [Streptomyces sp. HNM0663]|uniref:Helix-turn-helix domain containing protein n=1 Tax=Streptomyces chengmaiensis TaxID=3040919 RepID=A0ABT6HL01_9ACTN|nr:helix-turn-helix domain containing protein [Streptomyces chengmaiensis]MDH2389413.1 helix-turn-helix domain containing protein [Streptomyces chengmaiensis]